MSDVVAAETLSPAEQSRLADLEATVDHGLQTFVEVGLALAEIRDARLYRETHRTFEDYCRVRWGFAGSRARQLVAAAETVTTVTTAGLPAPGNERQVRELTPVLRDEGEQAVVEVWRELRGEYGDDVTAKKVRSLVCRRLERKRREEQRQKDRERLRARLVDASGGELECVHDVWYSTPRQELLEDYSRVVEALETLRSDVGRVLARQASEAFCSDWMPHTSIGDAIRGKRAATPYRLSAADVLLEVHRDLFGRPDVVEALRAIDDAFQEERAEFVDDLAAWLSERAERIGETVAPLLAGLLHIADGLPDTRLKNGEGWRYSRRARTCL